MRQQLERRLEELKKEYSTGRARAAELEQQQTTLHQTLLRISGAIQVLEEELAKDISHGESGDLHSLNRNEYAMKTGCLLQADSHAKVDSKN